MSDEIPAETAQTTSPETPRKPVGSQRRLAHWLGELVTVFVGVYAAFFLNYRANHRQERQRREQLLNWVEERYTGVLNNSRKEIPKLQKVIDDFEKEVAAGHTPEINAIGWVGDYDPSDSAGLLQSGGYELLDIETIRDIRGVESSLREMISVALHAQQRSDALILPNRGKDLSIFYDPVTHRLRASYEWVPEAFKDLKDGFVQTQASCTKLLAQVKAERERGR